MLDEDQVNMGGKEDDVDGIYVGLGPVTPATRTGEDNLIETTAVNIEIAVPVCQVIHKDTTILPDLPAFKEISFIVNKDYNGIDKAIFPNLINEIYEDTVKWRKNMFLLPSGDVGKKFIR